MDTVTLLTWRVPRCDAAGIERATLPAAGLDAALAQARDRLGAAGLFHLATCQRVVWVVHGKGPVATDGLVALYRTLWGREPPAPERLDGFDAFRHLCEVASSLDSLVPGEPQVLGQVKDAANRCQAAGVLGAELRHLLDLVLRTAKEVRSRTSLFKGKVSLVGLAEQAMREALQGAPAPQAAVLGTGEIGGKAAQLVRRLRPEAGLHVASRSAERARAFAKRTGAAPHTLEGFLRDPPPRLGLLVLALRSEAAVVPEADLRRLASRHPLTVLDLAMPRNAQAPSAPVDGLRLVQFDDLVRASADGGARRAAAYDQARARLDDAVDRVRHVYDLRCRASGLRDLSRRFEDVMERRWREAGRALDTQDPKARKWYEQTVRALLHEATLAVKRPGGKA